MNELTIEQSEILTAQIEAIKSILITVDFEYLKAAKDELSSKGSRYDAGAVLVIGYDPAKALLFYAQSEALGHLESFHDALKRCQELKDQISKNQQNRENINKLFT